MAYLTPPDELDELLPGEPAYRSDQLRNWLYQNPVLTADDMTNIPTAVRSSIGERLWPFRLEVEQSADKGTTRKWLFRCQDGAPIEAVLMGYPKRTTLCISSQVGCALACTFCATGQFGFSRHLETGEIVAQVAYANAALRAAPMAHSPDRVTNVVFMGMGEPLVNYQRVREAIRRMIEVMGMSARSITVSTVGVVPGMLNLAEEPWPVNLAVSLHAADNETRSKLVPLTRRYPIEAIVDAADVFYRAKGRRVSLEWTLIAGSNDSPDQASKLAAIARRLHAHVNVIALNPTPLTADRPPDPQGVEAFIGAVRRAGANVTLRDTRGRDIDAACGQLRLRMSNDDPSPSLDGAQDKEGVRP